MLVQCSIVKLPVGLIARKVRLHVLTALMSTEWTLIFIALSIWSWLRSARYPTYMRSRARRRPARDPYDAQRDRAAILRFLAPPGALLFGVFSVSAWWGLLKGSPISAGGSWAAVLLSSLVLAISLMMAWQEVYLIRNGLAIRRSAPKRDSAKRRP